MKLNTRLIWIEKDPLLGSEGWRIKRIPSFYCTNSSRELTHDILEHSPRDKGTLREEVSAFGAILAYRLNQSDLIYPRMLLREKAYYLADELRNTMKSIVAKYSSDLRTYFSKLPKLTPPHCSRYSKIIANHLEYFIQHDDTIITTPELLKAINLWIVSWLNYGFSRARKIINSSGWYPADIWHNIQQQIQINLINCSLQNNYREVSVQIDFDRCWCEIVPIR